MTGFIGAMGWCLYSAQFTAWLILVRQVSRLENGPSAAFVYHVPTLLNTSQVGLKFIDVMGIRVSHWSLLLRTRGNSRHWDVRSAIGSSGPRLVFYTFALFIVPPLHIMRVINSGGLFLFRHKPHCVGMCQCPLWVIRRHSRRPNVMSALPSKADIRRKRLLDCGLRLFVSKRDRRATNSYNCDISMGTAAPMIHIVDRFQRV
jgi:hypothetical protein